MDKSILEKFGLDEKSELVPFGNGHINDTFLVNDKYILQRINTNVFKDPEGLMNNILLVTEFLKDKVNDPEREVLNIVRALDGSSFVKATDGSYWRLYIFISDSLSLDQAESADDMRTSGFAFGDFQRKLDGFDASLLAETIPDFHNTLKRFEVFKQTIEKDPCGRKAGAQEEIDFYISRLKLIEKIFEIYSALPLRVTHNDTKLNNVLFDKKTKKPLCVIDLDTVMPGYVANDFGDAVRFGASTAAEDEKDLSKVHFDRNLYNAFLEGFLDGFGDAMTEKEKASLPYGAILMTFECGMRFLTDYIDGDNYFKTAYPEHNLVRCRTQARLVEEMEKELI